MSSQRGLLVFRTHVWDRAIAAMAQRAYARRGGWDFAVLVDETRQSFETPGYVKIAHNEDFSDLGLPRSGDPRELWYNSDYSFYRLLAAAPDCSYFCISEYDVFINCDLGPLFDVVAAEGLDVVSDRLGPAPEWWMWNRTARDAYPVVHWSFNPFIVLSRRALEHLLARRQALGRDFRAGRLRSWPFFEAFVGSEFCRDDRFRAAPLTRFGALAHFSWGPPYQPDEAARFEDDFLLHPVLSGEMFVRSLLRCERRPLAYFAFSSALRRRLADQPRAVVYRELYAAIGRWAARKARRAFTPAWTLR